MPPQTRKKISAPPDRVYTSSTPLVQKTFKPKKKRIKSYGKKSGARVPKQETLTQMDYLMFRPRDDIGEEEEEEEDREEDQDEADAYEEEEAKRKKKRRKTVGDQEDTDNSEEELPKPKQKKKRRKTLGDVPSSESKYHTQRLTQMDWSFTGLSGEHEDEEDKYQAMDPVTGQNHTYEEPANGQQRGKDSSRIAKSKGGDALKMGPPQTPKRNLRFEIPATQSPATPIFVFKPQAQNQSPLLQKDANRTMERARPDGTKQSVKRPERAAKFPGLGRAQESLEALQPANTIAEPQSPSDRLPLRERSINAPIPFSISPRPKSTPYKAPKLVIEDTSETENESLVTRFTSSPPKLASPSKVVRFNIPDKSPTPPKYRTRNSPSCRTQSSHSQPPVSSHPPASIGKTEISDSEEDDEDDLDYEPQVRLVLDDHQIRFPSQERHAEDETGAEDDLEIETQKEDLTLKSTLDPVDQEVADEDIDLDLQSEEDVLQTRGPGSLSQAREQVEVMDCVIKTEEDLEEDFAPETYYDEFGAETQVHLAEAERRFSSTSSGKTTPNENASEELFNERCERSQHEESQSDGLLEVVHGEKSQYMETMESQRLSTQHVRALGPRKYGADALVSYPPNKVTSIVDRSIKYYFRHNSPLPKDVSRLWIYETKPVETLKYMVVIRDAGEPSELQTKGEKGNAEFKSFKFAYEIMELYELANPLHLSKLHANEWLQNVPRLNEEIIVTPGPLGQLMANLKPPIFTTPKNKPSSSSNDTQEVEAQLVSESTQFQEVSSQHMSSQRPSRKEPSPQLGSSPIAETPHRADKNTRYVPLRDFSSSRAKPTVRPSQASTVDLTQPPTQARPDSRDSDVEIVFESPVRHCPSSTPLSLPTPHRSSPEDNNSDPLVPLSMASSQILTKSQLLPESLLTESVPLPPPFVSDSDDEDDEDYL